MYVSIDHSLKGRKRVDVPLWRLQGPNSAIYHTLLPEKQDVVKGLDKGHHSGEVTAAMTFELKLAQDLFGGGPAVRKKSYCLCKELDGSQHRRFFHMSQLADAPQDAPQDAGRRKLDYTQTRT